MLLICRGVGVMRKLYYGSHARCRTFHWICWLTYYTQIYKFCQWLATGRWFSPGTPVSSTNKTDRHDITEILLFVWLMIFNATFNTISVISWRSVLLVEETRVPGENHRPIVSHRQTLLHNVVHLALIEIRTHNISRERNWLHR
jgi:hypothetical protein